MNRYWDVEIRPEEYSYLDAAISQGYSVLTFDMIGTGKSDKPNAYTTVQLEVQIEILAGLTELARSGELISSSTILSSTGGTPIVNFQPSQIVHVGHSYGSFIMAGMLEKYGSISDAAIMTGFYLTNQLGTVDVAHFNHEYAAQHDPERFGGYGSGYFVLTSESTLQELFLRKGGFEPDVLTYLETIKQPEGIALYPSGDTYMLAPAMDFRGPVMVSWTSRSEFAVANDDFNTVFSWRV
jgi:pimeloyl-ACP methyl ester carboxylesterase